MKEIQLTSQSRSQASINKHKIIKIEPVCNPTYLWVNLNWIFNAIQHEKKLNPQKNMKYEFSWPQCTQVILTRLHLPIEIIVIQYPKTNASYKMTQKDNKLRRSIEKLFLFNE